MLNQLPNLLNDPNAAFVIANSPHSNFIEIIHTTNNFVNVINDVLELSHQIGFVFAPFDLKDNNTYLLQNTNVAKLSINEFNLLGLKINSEQLLNTHNSLIYNSISKEHYIEKINSTKELIKQSQCKKLVFSRVIKISLQNKINPIKAFLRLVENNQSAFCYLIKIHNEIWLGATPETLFSYSNNELKTMALAGTLSKNETDKYEWTQKEIEEHEFVCEHLQKQLTTLNLKGEKGIRETIAAGSVVHLQTKFNFTSNQSIHKTIGEITNALQPTPAVAGTPVEAAKKLIPTLENYNRSYYTGFLGFINSTNGHLYVNLRCMKWQNNEAIIFVGGGITKDSDPKKEWEETELKAKTMILALEEQLDN